MTASNLIGFEKQGEDVLYQDETSAKNQFVILSEAKDLVAQAF